MPHYMVPRYVRFIESLPKTPTQKVQKAVLRTEGVTPDTWDREAAGMAVRRTKLS
jgi:crotonobetaine/carnitine-CoA ligase